MTNNVPKLNVNEHIAYETILDFISQATSAMYFVSSPANQGDFIFATQYRRHYETRENNYSCGSSRLVALLLDVASPLI